jgi:coenzyme PQQ synthesis protein D (PqqD)
MDRDALPRRAEDIEVNRVPDGYIVYQPSHDRVHYLNHTAVLVLELCTGRVRASDMPRLLKDAYDLPEPPTDEVAACLDTLSAEGLIRQ